VHIKSAYQLIRTVNLSVSAVQVLDRVAERVAAVGGADDGSTKVGDTAHAVSREVDHAALKVFLGHQ